MLRGKGDICIPWMEGILKEKERKIEIERARKCGGESL
jgi:hypothetical protein